MKTLKAALVVAALGGVGLCIEAVSYASPGEPGPAAAITMIGMIEHGHARHASPVVSSPLRIEDYLAPRHVSFEALALAKLGGFDAWLDGVPKDALPPDADECAKYAYVALDADGDGHADDADRDGVADFVARIKWKYLAKCAIEAVGCATASGGTLMYICAGRVGYNCAGGYKAAD